MSTTGGGALPVFRAVVVEPRGIEFGNESNSSAGEKSPIPHSNAVSTYMVLFFQTSFSARFSPE